MSRRLFNLAGCGALVLAMAAVSLAQTQTNQQPTRTTTTTTTQTTQAVQNADGTWSVIEYPANKEVIVDFTPANNFSGATGRARVMRMSDHTMINLDLSGLPANATGFNLYAVDPMGKVTTIGPVSVTNGTVSQQFTTPLNRFMLVLSPDAGLTTYAPDTTVAFRSAVPQGFAVLPLASSGERDGAAVGERVAATTTTSTSPANAAYNAPLLGIPNWRQGTDTHMKINFTGELTGSRANVFIEPRKDGATTIKMRFHELKDAPGGKRYVLWAVGPNNDYHRLGQVVNTGQRNEAQIQTETGLRDFGLFITTEDVNDAPPTGTVIGTVVIDNVKP
ncbi:MAG TPA: hypothetical protein VM934_03045 [Pyrinomonadaceae bacterium]|jgi:hypothetical protein|nr:hypothetical protein [Pyrinomonadaceae bacterium]